MSGRFELRRDQLERGTGPDSETQAETNTETETEAISRRVLRLMGGGEALDVLLTSRERVEMDLDASLTMASMIASSDLTPRVSLAVREWVEVPLWTELRGFVVNGQLTALTQQDTRHPSPHLLRHKAQIERLIVQFSNTHLLPAMASVGLSSGVVDYGLCPPPLLEDRAPSTLDDWRVLVFEVNSFGFRSGPGCFDWTEEDDCKVLFHGPFEFRVVEAN
mmetsp:Transcript_61776/g.146031  ORF Transcript_61776/g.146031 Transcript_61776/m.146031 type:complete len:220 (-) Transcript_61776:143-802(-)